MKAKCELIRDLLPLYHDGVCSDVSKEIVEEHLKTCEACKEELRLMDETFPTSSIQVEETEVVNAAASTWKKGKRKSILKGGFVALFLVTVLLVAYVGMHFASTANGKDFSGLGKLAANYFDCEQLAVEKTATNGGYLVALCKDDNGKRYLCVYEKDGVLGNRWHVIAGEHVGADGKPNHKVFTVEGEQDLVVIYGFNLPNEEHIYSFRTEGNMHYCYLEGTCILDIFMPSKSESGFMVTY